MVPNLESLILEGCTRIVDVHPSIGVLKRLKLLSLRGCKSLRSLPPIIGMKSLEQLILSDCSNLKKIPEIDGEMEYLLEVYLDGTRFKELPSSIGHLNNLVLLNLKDCSNLVSLPSSIDGCKCLKILNLSGCSKLETLPENLKQVEVLEELDLSETAIRKPPAFIFQFKNMKVLSFEGCNGPPSKLRPILPSLFKVLQRGSMDSTALMLPPLSGLSSLTKLNLSDCNLWDGAIPSDICSLSFLEELKLSDNNFTSLPASLTLLSKLRYLDLSDCRRLKSLPNLLTRIGTLVVNGCASLEVIANPSTGQASCTFPYISGINCFRLVENKNALKRLKEYIEVLSRKNQYHEIVIPGSEISEWFNHQRKWDGSSIKVPLPSNIQNDNQWVGVALCLVFVSTLSDDDDYGWWRNEEAILCKAVIHGTNSREGCWFRLFFVRNCKRLRIMKDHLWLRYLPRDHHLFRSPLEDERGETENLSLDWANQECNEIEFIFKTYNTKVKKCGIRLVCEKDLEETEKMQEGADLDDIYQDIADDHGLTGNGGVLVKRKRDIYEEAGSSDQPEERSNPQCLH